ncbi:hypothetical protein [Marinobacterium jannaschii]|uniref:hypothetical protein n=1 Tax=Marinobacterium jannaschii TaxID=64970 RepID=UPI000487CB86|nr:hypothetical protein [Marinobacterium jannaschii]
MKQQQQQQALDSYLQQQEWQSYRQLMQRYNDPRLALHLLEELSCDLVNQAAEIPQGEWQQYYQQRLQTLQEQSVGLLRFLLRLSQPAVADEVQAIGHRLKAIRKAAVYGVATKPDDVNKLWLDAIGRSYRATLWLIALLFLLYWGLIG